MTEGSAGAAGRFRHALFDNLAAERERWVLWLPVALGAGIAFYFALPFEPAVWAGPLGLLCAVALGAAARRRTLALVLSLSIGAVAAGFTLASLRTAYVAAPVLEKRIGPVTVRGNLVRLEQRTDGARLTFERPEIAGLEAERTPARVRIRVHGTVAAPLGSRVELRAVLTPPAQPVAPGAFDFSRRAFFEGVGGFGYALGRLRVLDPSAHRPGEGTKGGVVQSGRIGLAALRQRMTARILAGLDGVAGAVAAALLTGERGALPEAVWVAMRGSGLAHLLAISGLHIGLVAGLLFVGARALLAAIEPVALRVPVKKWAASVALVGAFAYLLVSGATVPTQRAFLTIGLMLLAILLDRTGVSLRLVAWAAGIVLVLAPESLLGPSFQMSFAAAVALVAAYEAARSRYPEWRRAPWWKRAAIYLAGIAFTTLVAGAATTPFVLYHFNRVAAYSVAANLIAVPVTSLWIMPWGLGVLLLMPFGLERLALAPMGLGIEWMLGIAEAVSGWRGAVAHFPALPLAGLLPVVIGGLWLTLWRRRWRWLGFVGIAAGLSALLFVRPPDVLVDGDARLLAVRTEAGELLLSSTRRERWSAEQWLRRAGAGEAGRWPAPGEATANSELACDSLGCIFRKNGRMVALVRDGRALAEDCRMADVVVSLVPLRAPCPSAVTVIDRFDLWRKGGHALWLDRDGARVATVRERQGQRPWSRATIRARRASSAEAR
jgi:competence protein ComEC